MPDSSSLFAFGQGSDSLSAGLAAGSGSSWLVVLSLGVVTLVVMALLNERTGNDDDDSSPGGGLMQPVA